MKKIFMLSLALWSSLWAGSLAQEPVEISIVINGQALSADPPPRMVEGRVLIPLRKVFSALGADVKYENKIITAKRGERVVVLSPNQPSATIDDKAVELDVPPLLFDSSTYVPLRFVAQALGDSVVYDGKAKTITVSPLVAEDPIDVPLDRVEILKSRLKQLVVGHQGAILKVRNEAGDQEVYFRGLDDRDTAPYDDEDQVEIIKAIALNTDVARWTADTIEAFKLLPKREAVAFLGIVYSIPSHSPLDPGPDVDRVLREFLVQVVAENPDVVVRRQAVLSMAVGDEIDPEVLESVLKLYESSENLWETFPVQQYFQYHAQRIKSSPQFQQIRQRVSTVNSLYTANILHYLDN